VGLPPRFLFAVGQQFRVQALACWVEEYNLKVEL
jgi:hypothetical protein